MRKQRHGINGVLTLLNYGIFALFSLMLVVTGAQVYRNIVNTGSENTQMRSSFSYVANKVRMSARSAGTVRMEERDGIDVLVLESLTEGYETRIYYYDGALREAYQAVERDFIPEMGEEIMELPQFRIEETESGQLVLTALDAEGNQCSLHLHIEGKSV